MSVAATAGGGGGSVHHKTAYIFVIFDNLPFSFTCLLVLPPTPFASPNGVIEPVPEKLIFEPTVVNVPSLLVRELCLHQREVRAHSEEGVAARLVLGADTDRAEVVRGALKATPKAVNEGRHVLYVVDGWEVLKQKLEEVLLLVGEGAAGEQLQEVAIVVPRVEAAATTRGKKRRIQDGPKKRTEKQSPGSKEKGELSGMIDVTNGGMYTRRGRVPFLGTAIPFRARSVAAGWVGGGLLSFRVPSHYPPTPWGSLFLLTSSTQPHHQAPDRSS